LLKVGERRWEKTRRRKRMKKLQAKANDAPKLLLPNEPDMLESDGNPVFRSNSSSACKEERR
jgi:hypothetical protein